MKKALVTSLLISTLGLTACSSVERQTSYTSKLTSPVAMQDYEFVGPRETKVAAQIGEFQVPENRLNPNSRMITIKYVKFPTTSANPKAPIVYLAGGPGGSATGTAKRQRFPLFMKLREVSDVILYDQRGTGLSNDMEECKGQDIDLSLPTSHQPLIEAMKQDIKTCVSKWQDQGIDLDGYNTKQSAQDLVDLTAALGVDKVNLWGISYGTHLAFATAKYHPEIVDNMVLASSEGLGQTVKLPSRVQGLITKVSGHLRNNEATKDKYPDVEASIKRVLDKLEVEPVIVKTKDFRTRETITVGIGKMDIQFALSYIFLRDANRVVAMPRMFKDMEQGKFEEIASYVAFIKQMGNSYKPMALAMDKASGISKDRWELVQKQAKTALVGRTTNFPVPDINDVLPVKDLGDEFRQEVTSDIRTLFLAGTLDGRTLYESQLELAKNFKNGEVLTIDGAGHNLFMAHEDITTSIHDFLMGNALVKNTIELPELVFQ